MLKLTSGDPRLLLSRAERALGQVLSHVRRVLLEEALTFALDDVFLALFVEDL